MQIGKKFDMANHVKDSFALFIERTHQWYNYIHILAHDITYIQFQLRYFDEKLIHIILKKLF